MSVEDVRFVNADQNDTELMMVDVTKNSVSLSDNRFLGTPKDSINLLTEKVFNWNASRTEVAMCEAGKTIVLRKMADDTFVVDNLSNCSLCQNPCANCKQRCVTCKFPCSKCNPTRNIKNSSTDTDDFDSYLESHVKKIKIQPKVKTTGTDTCDLEGHFDYYKLDKKEIRIQKHVATDCADLNAAKYVSKKSHKKTAATDTTDLSCHEKTKLFNDSNSNFFWKSKDESKARNENNTGNKSALIKEEKCVADNCEKSGVVEEESTMFHLFKGNEDNKENLNVNLSAKEITYDCSSTSDESDVDVITSCKLSKCRQLARLHKISAYQITKDSKTFYKCSLCEKTFPKKYLCVLHLGNHIDENTFKCLTCPEQYNSLNMLLSHIQKTHFSNNDSVPKTEETDAGSINENKENSSDTLKKKVSRIYQCTLCSKDNELSVQFKTYKALYLHKKLEHGVCWSKSGKGGKGEKKVRVKREFICLLCGKQFRNSKALEDHHPVHTGEKNYLCDICNKFYSTSANLTIHKRTHLGTKNFACTVCNKAFHKKDSLKVHFRKHSGERPFQCDLCPMKFDRNYILKNHRYTHSSERAFICPICGKTFSTNGGLSNHEKNHKKDPSAKKPRKPAVKPTLDTEKAVICDICGKIYSTKSNLRIHKFIHTGLKPFKCTICHQTYAKKDSLLTHMRKHTDERPFACETCGMTFYRNHTLKTHVLRHTGEKPHKCKICGKSFTQSSSLRYHVKNHDKKIEKKKVIGGELNKAKKKRMKPAGATTKKIAKPLKLESEFQVEELKPEMESKKLIEGSSELMTLKEPIPPGGLSEKLEEFSKGGHFMLPMGEQEIFILDKNLSVELPKSKDIDFFSLEKDPTHANQFSVSKFNYYIAKSHVFSFPKDTTKLKGISKDVEISIEKNDDHSKNAYITKEGNTISLNENSTLKEIKEDYVQISDQRLNLKPQAIPITGEILNATFISDENGDMIPFNPMALQGLGAENVMISPVISLESDEKKGFLKNPRLSVMDSKIMYNIAAAPRIINEKIPENKNCNVISVKDERGPPKIHIELEPPSMHIEAPVVDDSTINGITTFYSQSGVQENEI